MQLLGPKDVAALLGVHERTAIKLFATGEIRAFRAGPKLWRTTREVYDAWVAEKLQPDRRNCLTEPVLPMRVLVRDRNRSVPDIPPHNGAHLKCP